MRYLILSLAGAALVFAGVQFASANDHSHSASDAQVAAQHKSHAHHRAGYMKPGAAVALSHDYDGKTEVGELETVTVTLSHIYQDGTLSAALLSSPDIQISAFNPIENMPVYPGSTLDFPIQFSSTKRGQFTLSLEIVYESPEGQESRRVLSVPVNIGGELLQKTPASEDVDISTASKSGVIPLAAIEVIE